MIVRLITNTLVSNRTFVIPYLVALCAGTLALSFWNKEALFLHLHDVHSPGLDFFFKYFTVLGDGLTGVVIVLILAFIHFGKSAFLALSFALSGLLAQLLKKIVFPGALRPSGLSDLETSIRSIEGVDLHVFHSFPSGHTVTAFSVFFALTLVSKQKWLGYVFFLIALGVGYSRVYIGQHFFADIYYGSILGILSTLLVWGAFYKQLDKPWAQKSLLKLKS